MNNQTFTHNGQLYTADVKTDNAVYTAYTVTGEPVVLGDVEHCYMTDELLLTNRKTGKQKIILQDELDELNPTMIECHIVDLLNELE